MSSSLASVKARNEARLMEEQRTERRRMALLVLIHHQLLNSGYIESAERLQAESGIAMTKHEVADNIDLMSILQDYEDYFQMRFNKQPKFIRKRGGDDHPVSPAKPKKSVSSASPSKPPKDKYEAPLPPPSYSSSPSPSHSSHSSPSSSRSNSNSNLSTFLPRLTPPSSAAPSSLHFSSHPSSSPSPSVPTPVVTANSSGQTTLALNGIAAPSYNSNSSRRKAEREDGEPRVKIKEDDMGLSGKPLTARKNPTSSSPTPISDFEQPIDDFYDFKLLKPLPPHLTGNSEFRELSAIITRDIFLENPNVKWTDIVGLENAKRLLNEAVTMPIKYPQLFTGLLSPWKGILLFGPPGTGKTMLAKAVASMSRTTFFNISAASIVSKWRGDSEKLVRVLFELARHHAPSTIFLDEIDALMSHRGGDSGGEHEASRRMKTELLIQVDGLARSTEQVFLLAVSNLPWALDSALLRRLEKRIYVPLPSEEAREDMFRHYLPPEVARAGLPYKNLAENTEGYSGSDIRLVCKETSMAPLRRLVERLERGELEYSEDLKTEPVTIQDVEAALKSTKSSAHRDLDKYLKWQAEFGSV